MDRKDSPVVWPSLEEELKVVLPYLKGNVLNAGSGNRDISGFVTGKVYNLDIYPHKLPGGIMLGSVADMPLKSGFFDAVVCNAVLEHVKDPPKAVTEMGRVLKTGGYLYLSIPFLQPVHDVPGDYIRYTLEGLRRLVEDNGFRVVEVMGIHTAYHTLGWIAYEWLTSKRCLTYSLLKLILYPLIRYKSAHSKHYVESIASAYSVLAVKK